MEGAERQMTWSVFLKCAPKALGRLFSPGSLNSADPRAQASFTWTRALSANRRTDSTSAKDSTLRVSISPESCR